MSSYLPLLTTTFLVLTACQQGNDQPQQLGQTTRPAGQSALMHIAINTINLDSTLAFYKNAFGYAKHYQWTQATNPKTGQVLFRGQGIYVDLGGQTYLELFPTGQNGQSMKTGTVAHFSLAVADIDQVYQKALKFGAKPKATTAPTYWNGRPTTIELNGNPKLSERVAYIEGLNGEAIELYEVLTPIVTR